MTPAATLGPTGALTYPPDEANEVGREGFWR